MAKKSSLTHWLQSPNKNYFGHWDLPQGKDLILTIKEVAMEDVKNPVTKEVKRCKVVSFEEDFKPFICNQTNAKAIMKSVGDSDPEKSIGKKIKLSMGKTSVGGEEVDCIRVKAMTQEQLAPGTLTEEQIHQLTELMTRVGQDEKKFCQALKISQISEVPVGKFEQVMKQLRGKISVKKEEEK